MATAHLDPNPQNLKNPNMGLPVQYIHGMASCSEWSGVPFSVLLNEAGVKKEASWLVLEGGDQGKFGHPSAGQGHGRLFRGLWPEWRAVAHRAGLPDWALVPGWEGPHNVKYLKNIKVVDQPYNAWNESMNHSSPDPISAAKCAGTISSWARNPSSRAPRPASKCPPKAISRSRASLGPAAARSLRSRFGRGGKNWKEGKFRNPFIQGAYPIHLRLGVGRTRGRSPVPLDG